jgi:hypothetical protein
MIVAMFVVPLMNDINVDGEIVVADGIVAEKSIELL